jgi:hypothetical protein
MPLEPALRFPDARQIYQGNEMSIFWHKFFKLPQTQLLLLGVVLGYSCLLWVLRPHPLTVFGGGLIALATMGAWAFEVRKEFSWMQENLLDRDVFLLHFRMVEQIVDDYSSKLWQDARSWVLDIQEFAYQIGKKEPNLTPELLEILYTTLFLVKQLLDTLMATHYVKTKTYREMAQQQLRASYNRLQTTHDQLEVLHDQVVLLSLDRISPSDMEAIPLQLQIVIEANRTTLQAFV